MYILHYLEKILDVLLSSPAGVSLLTVSFKGAGIMKKTRLGTHFSCLLRSQKNFSDLSSNCYLHEKALRQILSFPFRLIDFIYISMHLKHQTHHIKNMNPN